MQAPLGNSSTRVTWFIIFATVLVHLALHSLPLINLEWAFSDAARYFENPQQDYLDRYFSVQANTLGIPLLAVFVHHIVPYLDIGLIPRLISISGFVFLGAALMRFNKLMGSPLQPALLISLVFLNPLIWTFGGRGTADFFPAALALYGVTLFWDKQTNIYKLLLGTLCFSLAITFKYHAILLLPLIWLEAISRPQCSFHKTLRLMGLLTLIILVTPVFYLFAIHRIFGFWLTPHTFQDTHQILLDAPFALANFVSYAGYLALLLFPLSLMTLGHRTQQKAGWLKTGAASAALFLAGYFLLEPNGEMNFGPLDAFLNPHVVGALFCLSAALFFLVTKDGLTTLSYNSEAHRLLLSLLVGIMIFIGALSFTRPAQRYLLFVLPLAYPFATLALSKKSHMALLIIALSIAANIYITLNQYATGQAALALTQKIQEHGLMADTNPGAIAGHTGNFFPVNRVLNKKYIVIAGTSSQQLFFSESAPFPLVHKTYALIPLVAPPDLNDPQ